MADKDLQGRVAVVTGAGRGIGRATALALSALGASVVVNDNGTSAEGVGTDAGPADEVAAEIVKRGGKAVANHDSVADYDSAGQILASAMNSFGRIDILVNNAGTMAGGPIYDLDPSVFESVVRTHLFGAFYCTRHACLPMKEQGSGRIVNLVSRAGLMGAAGAVAYGSGKGGIYGLTNASARDLAPFGITVNAVNPAATKTRMVTDAIDRARSQGQDTGSAERMLAQMQTPEDVAVVIAYLCTDAAADVNGQTFIALHGAVGLVPTFAATKTISQAGPYSVAQLAAAFAGLEVPPMAVLY